MDAIETVTPKDLDHAEAALRVALADRGFGVLTEIDVAATLQSKLGIERAPLRILGACNPSLAHEALQLDPAAALVLPCNVALEPAEGGGTRIAAVDPRSLMPGEAFAELAATAAGQIRAALDAVDD